MLPKTKELFSSFITDVIVKGFVFVVSKNGLRSVKSQGQFFFVISGIPLRIFFWQFEWAPSRGSLGFHLLFNSITLDVDYFSFADFS